ncbi:MAG: bifunctional DNA-binding transcriptional regulator/O6-methylguanine-DNA methyltransferase Ada [Vicinamibacterales bacterium]|nr:bifunctional DNA-binding transcriptional regulator/O6-methylguanine-DNA methyltransferase Ada [Vicinamibacterales bacterium]
MLTISMPPHPAPARPPRSADDLRWRAVISRDRSHDGAFVYAVRTTGIYCRPVCPSRRPLRASVVFYPSPEAAEARGFRACKRCHPQRGRSVDPGVALARQACAFIATHADEPVNLARVAAHADVSRFHLQRTFARVVGLSPRAYLEAVRASRFKAGLREGTLPLAGAVYEAGYGSSSRVYERKPTGSVTPGSYRTGGKGLVVRYSLVDSALGRLLVAGTDAGVCAVKLGDADAPLVAELRGEFPAATIEVGGRALAPWVQALRAHAKGRVPDAELPLDVRATAFQWQVWRFLQSIPLGETRTYSEVAKGIRRPAAVRAVARACATNPVALAVPCHRVIGKDGTLTGYRWGLHRKDALLKAERH